MTVENVFLEAKMLRDVVGAVINHLAGGGHVRRGDQFFSDLKRVHRATRDIQAQLQANPQYLAIEYWQQRRRSAGSRR